MNYRSIWELIKINILYSNPQALTTVQKKREKNPDKQLAAYKTVLRQQLFLLILFLFIYSTMFLVVDYSKSSGYFSFQVALFSTIAIISGFTTLFAVFYDSNDIKLYLPLPVKEKEVYLAKLISSQGGSLPFLMPIISLFGIAYWQMTHSILLAIIATIINFLLLLLAINSISIILIYLIGQVLVKSAHKKLISTILMFFSIALAIGVLFYVQFTNQSVNESGRVKMMSLPYFRGFHDIVINPFSTASLLNFWLGIVVTIILLVFIQRTIISHYFEQFLAIQEGQSNKKKVKLRRKDTSLAQTLRKHHLDTLKDATLLIQSYLMPLIFIIAFIGPILSSGKSLFQNISSDFFGIAFIIGIILGSFIATPTSFMGVGISLEKENYTFLKTLPISFKTFLKQKFYYLLAVQAGFLVFIYLIIGLFLLNIPIILLISFIIGMVLSTFILGELMYWRDYRLLTLHWQNVAQLFSRGSGQWFLMAVIFGNLLIGSFLLVLAIIVSLKTSVLGVGITLVVLVLLLFGGLHRFIQQRFWKKLI
ncbi:ABC transporter permease [Streptococcus troglodytae]|uniref:ABC transporter permease n=1 Tax=Streptococcus troglodytae TaxID=1111760 RepID=A0A1L7LJ78_9STRE|nr:ABC transporter permease [Streptococcus troglodytae]BAQ24251.1 ABC transporter permease [Streptococcus troglodytae]